MKEDTLSPIRDFVDVVRRYRSFAVISHLRPDGDAIGSTLALGLALRGLGKEVVMWNADSVPSRFAFLEGAESMQPVPGVFPCGVEVLICVDAGDWKRLGDLPAEVLKSAPFIVNIDHHSTNTCYGRLNIVQGGAAATGCVLLEVLDALGATITPAIANALYAAISTDTGSFQFSCTTPKVMRDVARLMECGVDVGDINRRLYQEQPLAGFIMQKEVLNHMVVECGGMLSHYSMPAGTKANLEVGPDDTKDLVDIIRPLQGVKLAIIFEDLEDGRIRMSLRSKDPRVNVAELASPFGGGGHAMAAGIRMRGSLEECREKVLAAARRILINLGH